ncbi:inositol monophosphatase family protein [Anaerobacillus alkaliphilus]|uniref:inositol-phosphate phosphatase n=1 Tax=Anaerobacillus alkaliphilus TaxID=1548597 RepID=A0A4Q0VP58_9BACI|nr:inositol monophosphatase family protein [Anaerobacillus alkaliphilus]RXI98153.1 inositol monophosphatase family protein [Anaerobacillus alkaliphilus]
MSNNDWDFIANKAENIVREAAQLIKHSLQTELIVEYKSNPNDLVTEMDRKIEAFFCEQITNEFPKHYILGEEGTGKDLNTLDGTVWIIDPIDGTTNFVHQQRHFAISVGIYEDGVGKVGIIYDVMADELYLALENKGAYLNGVQLPMLKEAKVSEALIALNSGWILKDERLKDLVSKCRGTRAYGAAAIEMASVAANRIDGYISLNLSPWDFAAGAILIKEVGAVISTIDGKELDLLNNSSLCVAKNGLYQELQNDFLNKKG